MASNARDAMPHGGRFSIETAEVVLAEGTPASHGEMRSGQYVVLTLADDGVGMDAETQELAFEPFFTTKAAEGSGLGLASVYGTVRQLNGQVSLSSEPGRGTTLSIYLPALSRQRRVTPERPGALVAGGSETILLAEDDDQIRTLVARVLSDKGYRVLVAASGEEALALAREEPDDIDLLITDVVMGAMSGPELADRLRAERPSMATLITSGYPDVPNARDARIVGKPYGPLELAQHVRSVLGTPRRPRRVEVTR